MNLARRKVMSIATRMTRNQYIRKDTRTQGHRSSTKTLLKDGIVQQNLKFKLNTINPAQNYIPRFLTKTIYVESLWLSPALHLAESRLPWRKWNTTDSKEGGQAIYLLSEKVVFRIIAPIFLVPAHKTWATLKLPAFCTIPLNDMHNLLAISTLQNRQ